MSFLELNQVRFHVQELGPGAESGESTPAFMAHGLLVDNLASWYFGAAPRVARDRRVVLYDLRGHGRSEAVRSGYDVATGAADLACRSALRPRLSPACTEPGTRRGTLATFTAGGNALDRDR